MDKEIAQLTITDLSAIKQIIETACSRGTFQASEMRTVGEVYERLDSFLRAIVSAAEQAQPPQGEAND